MHCERNLKCYRLSNPWPDDLFQYKLTDQKVRVPQDILSKFLSHLALSTTCKNVYTDELLLLVTI